MASLCKNGHERTPDNVAKSGNCKLCRRVYSLEWAKGPGKDKRQILNRRWMALQRIANPDKTRSKWHWVRYKLSSTRFIALLFRQRFCCPCGLMFSELLVPQVDHDHTCCVGEKSCGMCIRGLLCKRCNQLLGIAQDDPHYLPLFLVEYLASWLRRRINEAAIHAVCAA